MKNVFKFLSLGVLVTAFYAVSATSVFAQATLEECQKIYQTFLDNRKGPNFDAAITAGKEYLEKCKIEDQKEVYDYVTKQLPNVEKAKETARIEAIEKRFNDALKAKNSDGLVVAAKELINLDRPYSLDLMLDIASIGFDNAVANPPVDKYNNDALTYAKMALQKMSEGKTSGNGDSYGFYSEYKTTSCPDGKLNATGWMNYIIGYITYARLKQTKEGVGSIYKATQTGCFTKNSFAEPYRLIGAWYLDETIKLNNEYKRKTEANKNVETDETLAILAMIKGYAERALDAYARAYKIATARDSKSSQAYKDGLLNRVKEMYDIRYEDTIKIDAYIAEISSKPFIDPATPVTPVVEAVPTTGTTSSKTTSLSGSGSDTPAETVVTATKTTETAKTTTKTNGKAPAKKPASKKKGTR